MTFLRRTWDFAAGRKPHGSGCISRTDSKTDPSLALGELAKLRKKSMRKGAWWLALTGVERGIIDLTLRCVGFVRSRLLERVLREITGKLRYVLDHLYILRLEAIGRPIAERICAAAASMGVCGAERWKDDTSYIQLLGLNRLYSSG